MSKQPSLGPCLADLLENELPLLPGFKHNESQCSYGAAIARVLRHSKGATGLIEGDTGIGKTFAYLLALSLWVRQGKRRQAVVSTYSRQLQMQLLDSKNLVLLNTLLERAGQPPIRLVLRVGRNNYICPRRLAIKLGADNLDAIKPSSLPLELRRLVTLAKNGGGCLLNYPGNLPEGFEETDIGLRSGDEDTEDYRLARAEADAAELVVINHALLVHNLRMKSVVPGQVKDHVLVLDEAEHFPDVAEEVLSVGFSFNAFYSLIGFLEFEGLTEFWRERMSAFRAVKLAGETTSFDSLPASALQMVTELLDSVRRVRRSKARILRDYGDDYLEELNNYCDAASHLLKYIGSKKIVAAYSPIKGYLAIREPRLEAGRIIKVGHESRRTILTSATLSDLNHLRPNFTAISRLTGLLSPEVVGSYSPIKYGEMHFRIPSSLAPCRPLRESGHNFSLSTQYADWVMADIAENPIGNGHRRLLLCRSYQDLSVLEDSAKKAGVTEPLFFHKREDRLSSVVDDLINCEAGGTLITPAGWEGLSPSRLNNKPFWSEVGIVRLPFSPPDLLRQSALDSYLEGRLREGETRSTEQMSKGITYTEDRNRMLHKLRQGMGRLIRHRNDRGRVVIYDPRFPKPGDDRRPMLMRAIPFRFRHNYQAALEHISDDGQPGILSML